MVRGGCIASSGVGEWKRGDAQMLEEACGWS